MCYTYKKKKKTRGNSVYNGFASHNMHKNEKIKTKTHTHTHMYMHLNFKATIIFNVFSFGIFFL